MFDGGVLAEAAAASACDAPISVEVGAGLHELVRIEQLERQPRRRRVEHAVAAPAAAAPALPSSSAGPIRALQTDRSAGPKIAPRAAAAGWNGCASAGDESATVWPWNTSGRSCVRRARTAPMPSRALTSIIRCRRRTCQTSGKSRFRDTFYCRRRLCRADNERWPDMPRGCRLQNGPEVRRLRWLTDSNLQRPPRPPLAA